MTFAYNREADPAESNPVTGTVGLEVLAGGGAGAGLELAHDRLAQRVLGGDLAGQQHPVDQ